MSLSFPSSHGRHWLLRFFENSAYDLDAFGISVDLEYTKDPHDTQSLKATVERSYGRKYGQQIDKSHKAKGIPDKRENGMSFKFVVRRCQPEQIIKDENNSVKPIDKMKADGFFLKSHWYQTGDDSGHHENIVGAACTVIAIGCFNNFKKSLSRIRESH